MKANLLSLSVAALTAVLSLPAAATSDTITSVSTDVASNGTKNQSAKVAMMKCGKKYDMKHNEKDCENCDGSCGANCFKK